MNLKDVTPDSVKRAILEAAAQGQREIASAADSAHARYLHALNDARAAADLTSEIANIDAASLIAKSAVAIVTDLEFKPQYGPEEKTAEFRYPQLSFVINAGDHRQIVLAPSDSRITLPIGRYRAVFLLVPTEEPKVSANEKE